MMGTMAQRSVRVQMPLRSARAQHDCRLLDHAVYAFCSVCLLLALILLNACAPPAVSDEQIIRQGIDAAVRSVTTLEGDEIQASLSSEQLELFSDYGLDASQLMGLLVRKLTLSVDEVELHGERAQVLLTVTNIDFDALLQALEQRAESWSQSPEASQLVETSGETAVQQKIFALLEDLLSESSVALKTHQASISLTKDDEGIWSIDDEQAFARILFADTD